MSSVHSSRRRPSTGARPGDRAPPSTGPPFDACAATASHFLYAQRNVIQCLHHDSLAVDRRFDKHDEDVTLIAVDNVSERGTGRLVVSYDSSMTAIIWDIFTGDEVARFASYDTIKVAAWLRDGTVTFGDTRGNIILFDVQTNEHESQGTIVDPVTALAPANDSRTFAIGYHNGSILIATLLPNFTILHTLTTSRAPSPIAGLAWHGSSSKQKSDMLATLTEDGDLRIWSVSKAPFTDPPRIIRMIGQDAGPSLSDRNWFGWSKNGRIVHHTDGTTRTWDVRTKKVTCDVVPTVDNICAITNYGPSASLFTVARNFTVQQYDLSSPSESMLVADVQYVPPNAPPTPPDSIEERGVPAPVEDFRSNSDIISDGEAPPLSPLQKITQELEQMEERDTLGPLSPVSSAASMSSASSYGGRRRPRTKHQRVASSTGTPFSDTSSFHTRRESGSIRSGSSMNSPGFQTSRIRQESMRSPDESTNMKELDLFPYIKARLSEHKFRPPQYASTNLTPDILRKEMISVVFGWDHDIEALIRDEQSRHKQGSASSVLLTKWLGDDGANAMTQMIASEAMSSSDWMLLALSCQMGQGSQKQVGEAFVKRLLESNDIHPAVAILLGLGEPNDAVEVYVSRQFYMEAVLLTCLLFPSDWQRQSFLVRKWGETAVGQGQAELAVRCFSCTSIEPSEPWFSPRAQDAVYAAQQRAHEGEMSPPLSPPSRSGSNRMKNASLKLITSFGDKGAPQPAQVQQQAIGFTPIADTAIDIPSRLNWQPRTARAESQTRTATPGGWGRQRMPSTGRHREDDMTPTIQTAYGQRKATPSVPETAVNAKAPDMFRRDPSRTRGISRERNVNNLHIEMIPTVESSDVTSPEPSALPSAASSKIGHHRTQSSYSRSIAEEIPPGPPTNSSVQSYKARSIDLYINSLEEANYQANRVREQSRSRAESKQGRSRSRPAERAPSRAGDSQEVAYIRPAKRSPKSPAAMSSEEAAKYSTTEKTAAEEEPVERPRGTSRARQGRRDESPDARRARSSSRPVGRSASRMRDTEILSPRAGESSDEELPLRTRQRSSSRQARPSDARTRAKSASRRPSADATADIPEPASAIEPQSAVDSLDAFKNRFTTKQLAAQELELRRLSLAQKPSAPSIPAPSDYDPLSPARASPQAMDASEYFAGSRGAEISRSQTVDPEALKRHWQTSGTSTTSAPIGLPATPRAMRHPRYMTAEPDASQNIPEVPALPNDTSLLPAVSYQPTKTVDDSATLLPSTTYEKPPLLRTSSAPPEQLPRHTARPSLTGRGHSRKGSFADPIVEEQPIILPAKTFNANDSHADENIIVVEELPTENPPVLAELQHLAGPPPPPPPPTMYSQPAVPGSSGVISIAIDDGTARTSPSNDSLLTNRTSPSHQSTGSIGSKFRSGYDRLRSSSKSRVKSPSVNEGLGANANPYETVLPATTFQRTMSPFEQQLLERSRSPQSDGGASIDGTFLATQQQQQINESTINKTGSPMPSIYRNPKEIRANMPPQTLQAGVYRPSAVEG